MRMGVLLANAKGRWFGYWAGLKRFTAQETQLKLSNDIESHKTGPSPQRAYPVCPDMG